MTVLPVVASDTELSFVTPAHPAGAVGVVVTTAGGTSDPALVFTYLPVPTAASIAPDSGPEAGGQTVAISGSGFVDGSTTVSVGGAPATGVVVGGGGSIVAFTTPAGSPGVVDVTVTTAGGTTAPLAYTYLAAPTAVALAPLDGPLAGGTAVTVTGSGFVDGGTSVALALADGTTALVGTGAVTVSADGTTATFVTPPGGADAGAASVTLSTNGGTTAALMFTYLAVPTAVSLAPVSGPVAGGTVVSVAGSGFVDGGDVGGG